MCSSNTFIHTHINAKKSIKYSKKNRALFDHFTHCPFNQTILHIFFLFQLSNIHFSAITTNCFHPHFYEIYFQHTHTHSDTQKNTYTLICKMGINYNCQIVCMCVCARMDFVGVIDCYHKILHMLWRFSRVSTSLITTSDEGR